MSQREWAILAYVLRSGCQWRMLPRDYGTRARIPPMLRKQVRRQAGRESTPSAAISDSQSIRSIERGDRNLLRVAHHRRMMPPGSPRVTASGSMLTSARLWGR